MMRWHIRIMLLKLKIPLNIITKLLLYNLSFSFVKLLPIPFPRTVTKGVLLKIRVTLSFHFCLFGMI